MKKFILLALAFLFSVNVICGAWFSQNSDLKVDAGILQSILIKQTELANTEANLSTVRARILYLNSRSGELRSLITNLEKTIINFQLRINAAWQGRPPLSVEALKGLENQLKSYLQQRQTYLNEQSANKSLLTALNDNVKILEDNKRRLQMEIAALQKATASKKSKW